MEWNWNKEEVTSILDTVCDLPNGRAEVVRLCHERAIDASQPELYLDICREVIHIFHMETNW